MRQNYKFYTKKKKNTKPKEWPQQNRVEKTKQEKQQQIYLKFWVTQKRDRARNFGLGGRG